MKCFYHREADAVGSCKACNKGLCGTCAVDVSNGLACREQCEDEVRKINQLMDRSMRMAPVSEQIVGGQPRGLLVGATFALLAGIIFTVLGWHSHGVGRFGIMGIGVLVVLFGVWQLALGLGVRRAAGGKASGHKGAA